MSPRPRFEKLEPAKKALILEIAAEHFAESGYDGASLNAIIEQAGISKGAFYYYFDDKADLFSTTLRHAWSRIVSDATLDIDALSTERFWPDIFAFLMEGVASATQVPSLAGLGRVVYDPPADARVRAIIEAEFAQFFGFVRRLIERGRELRLVRRDLPLELLVQMVGGATQAADRWFIDVWETLPADELNALSLRLLDALRRMLEPPPAEEARR